MKRLLPIAFALLVMPTPATSQVYEGALGSQEYLNFVGVGSSIVGTLPVYVGPYTGHFSGDPTSQQFSLYCVDYDHHAGSQLVDVSSLGGDLSKTRLGSAGADAYQKSAYLSSLFDSWDDAAAGLGYAGQTKKTVWSALHTAIWTIVRGENGGSAVSPGTTTSLAMRDAFITLANYKAPNYDTSGWYLLSPADGYNGQEFLIRTPVPEPSTLLLMATGLLFIVVWRRKRTLGLVES